MNETVLYYTPGQMAHAAKLKGVLVQMGVRIKNIRSEQVVQTVGYLAGMDGYPVLEVSGEVPVLKEEMLVMKGFKGDRIDQLLLNLRKAGVPKINLKAVVTDSNGSWTFCKLYGELEKEHEMMKNLQS